MKKILLGSLLGAVVLAGCSAEIAEENGKTTVSVKVDKEEQQKRGLSEIMAEGSPIPFTEFDIVKNDSQAYQNRPFEDVPVEIMNVNRFSDHSIVRSEYKVDNISVHFTLLVDGNELDFQQGDYGYLSGIVADDVDMDSLYGILSIKGAFTGFNKVDELEFKNPNLRTVEVNQTKRNDYLAGTVERMITGDNFTVVYYSYTGVEEGQEVRTAGLRAYSNGEELTRTSLHTLGVRTELEGQYNVYAKLDTTQPFHIEIQGWPEFAERKQYANKNTDPLVFEFDSLE